VGTPSSRAAARLLDDLDRRLREAADPVRAVNEKRYLKSPIDHLGVRVPVIRASVKAVVRGHSPLTRRMLIDVVKRLWSSSIHEHRMSAVILLEQAVDLLESEDLALLREMIRGSFTWAYVDGLAARAAGHLVEHHPGLADELDAWADDDSFWVRRAAMLALMGPLRRGTGDWKRFTRFADSMLEEKEFFIRKAIGWVLRETSKKRPDRVRKYVESRRDRMAGLTLREATKYL
jgi:3-methyladenine DNA glycosylase AlkD